MLRASSPVQQPEPARAARAIPAYEITGPAGAPVVVALGGISATRHVCAHEANRAPGWWDAVAGPGRALDTTAYRIVSFDYVDGGIGHGGRPARVIRTHEQADALAAVLDAADVARVHAIVGASYGGMVALAFAERYPQRLERLVVIGAAHRSHPMTTALRSIQRRVVKLGVDTGRSHTGLSLARSLAITTYRSAREFGQRFDFGAVSLGANDAAFPVEAYLHAHGRRFADAWSPERFLALSLSADLHAITPGAIRVPTVLIAAENDAIVPRADLEELARSLGGPATLLDLPGVTGHDAFLTNGVALDPMLRAALRTPRFPGDVR